MRPHGVIAAARAVHVRTAAPRIDHLAVVGPVKSLGV